MMLYLVIEAAHKKTGERMHPEVDSRMKMVRSPGELFVVGVIFEACRFYIVGYKKKAA